MLANVSDRLRAVALAVLLIVFAVPALAGPFDELTEVEGDDAADSWAVALRQILEQWV